MGLRHMDLKGMIMPLIGIDKFQPKTGSEDEVIVVSFYLKDEMPAKDLEMFLEMGAIDSLDTEASPNPDKEGHYVVFIEFKRTKRFWLELRETLRDIENASGKQKWIVDVYKNDNLYKLNDPNLVSSVIIDPEEYRISIMDPQEVETDDFDNQLEDIRINEYVDISAYKSNSSLMEKLFNTANKPVILEKDHVQKLLNKYTGLNCERIDNLYLYEQEDQTVIFKVRD